MASPAGAQKVSCLTSTEHEEAATLKPHLPKVGRWSVIINDSWYLEMLAGFISLAAFGSIAGLLAYYDNKPVPPLIKGITVIQALLAMLLTSYADKLDS